MMSKEVRGSVLRSICVVRHASTIIHWTSGAAAAFVSCVSSPTLRGSEEEREKQSVKIFVICG